MPFQEIISEIRQFLIFFFVFGIGWLVARAVVVKHENSLMMMCACSFYSAYTHYMYVCVYIYTKKADVKRRPE